MILDNQAIFSSNQAITATAASTNAIDLLAAGIVFGQTAAPYRDIGRGRQVEFLCQVTEDFATLTSLAIALEQDSTTTFTPDKSISLGSYALAVLVAGFQIPWKYLPRGITMQYIQLKYTVTGSDATAGRITAGIVAAVQEAGTTTV